MFALFDTFNRRVISRHRSVAAAHKASRTLAKHLARGNSGAYLPTIIVAEERGSWLLLNNAKSVRGLRRLTESEDAERGEA